MQRSWVVVVLAGVVACSTGPGESGSITPGPTSPPGAPALPGGAASVAAAGPAPQIELAFGGDVMFGRFVERGFRPIRAEDHDPFVHIAPLLDSDFTVVNLETPVMWRPPTVSPYGTTMRFVTTPARVATLRRAGVDAVTIANNHAFDMRRRGLVETPAVLDELGFVVLGEERAEPPRLRVETVDVRGWRVGFVVATTEANWLDARRTRLLPYVARRAVEGALVPVIAAARDAHDLLIVVLHWGAEYRDTPERWQVEAARAFIDAGAAAVVAHHPHVLQGIERYRGGVIAYSLGNLLFDNLHGARRHHGILRLTFRRDPRICLERAVFHPTVGTRPHFTPRPARTELAAIGGRLRRLSRAAPLRATRWTLDGDRLITDGACAVSSSVR